MEKLRIEEYLENKSVLELFYTPYENKVEIVEVILSQVVKHNELVNVDTALLKRISFQVFMEHITNLDLSDTNSNGLNGYDYLCSKNEINDLLSLDFIKNELDRFNEILDCKLNDIYREKTSVGYVLVYIKNIISSFMKNKQDELNDYISNLDTKKIMDTIRIDLLGNIERFKK